MKRQIEALTDEKSKQEIAPGVLIERRRLLWLPALAVASFAFGTEAEAQAAKAEPGWDEFLKQCLPKAQELHKDSSRSGQEAYLRWLGLMAVNLRAADPPPAKLGKFKNLEPASFFGVGYRGQPFFVVEWRMEPGAFLPPHNHPNVSVCTVGLEGEARLRNFEIVGEAPEFTSTKPFRVRETHNEIIGAGRISTLSALRDNIHTFQAGKEGARGIDITTYHGANVGFSHLEFGGKPVDEQQRIYEAVWKKL
ncbi:MAG: hypothetical protein MOB07_15035 [Acidobacteria bacterium]|nr:hypothetical protein [Acidobacteriota bacterium]